MTQNPEHYICNKHKNTVKGGKKADIPMRFNEMAVNSLFFFIFLY
jgi:hypothetical protein